MQFEERILCQGVSLDLELDSWNMHVIEWLDL